jgi:predicted transcriptional regulator
MDKVKMSKKRDRLEVIYDFLCIIRDSHNSIKLTPLLRKTNLSSKRFYEYYSELTSKGFIKEVDGRGSKNRFVTLTDKGFKFIGKYKKILGFIDEFEL